MNAVMATVALLSYLLFGGEGNTPVSALFFHFFCGVFLFIVTRLHNVCLVSQHLFCIAHIPYFYKCIYTMHLPG